MRTTFGAVAVATMLVALGTYFAGLAVGPAAAQTRPPFSVYESGHYCIYITGQPPTMAIAAVPRYWPRENFKARCQ